MREIAGKGALLVGTAALVYKVRSYMNTKEELTCKFNEIQGELNLFESKNEANRIKKGNMGEFFEK